MTRQQFGTEVRRLLHRRVLMVFAACGLILLVLSGIGVFVSSGPNEDFAYRSGTGVDFRTVERTFCPSSLVSSQDGYLSVPENDDFVLGCPVVTADPPAPGTTYLGAPEMYFPWDGTIAMFTVAALLALWLLVASLVGGEFRHGTVETALVAEPRRARLLTLRLGAVVLVGGSTFLVAAIGFLVAMGPAWALRSIEGTGVPTSMVVAALGRGLLAAVIVCALSASLAVVGRGSLLSVGVLVGLAAVTGVLFVFMRDLVPVEFFTNTWAVVTGGDGIRTYVVDEQVFGGPVEQFGRGWPFVGAVAVVASYALVALAAAYVTFLRRDVR